MSYATDTGWQWKYRVGYFGADSILLASYSIQAHILAQELIDLQQMSNWIDKLSTTMVRAHIPNPMLIQGDTSGCAKPPADIDLKVAF